MVDGGARTKMLQSLDIGKFSRVAVGPTNKILRNWIKKKQIPQKL